MPRHWLRALLLLVVLAIAAFLVDAAWLEPSSIRLASYDVAVPAPLKGLRIAVISDLHAGSPWIDGARIDRIVAMTNATHPDLVVLAGDYGIGRVLGGNPMPIEEIAAHLKPLRARLGIYAVLGNHDSRATHFTAAFQSAGIAMLRNRHVALPGAITLAGIDDYYSGRADPALALAGVARDAICVAHTPDQFPSLPAACALTIAGHTHGGQIRVPLLGRPAVGWVASRYGQRYAIGVIREGGRTLFVSPGIGTSGLPLRFGVPPEISLLNLH